MELKQMEFLLVAPVLMGIIKGLITNVMLFQAQFLTVNQELFLIALLLVNLVMMDII